MSTRLPTKTKMLTLDQLDGRTAAAKYIRELMSSIEADLGGRDGLSTGELQLIQRIAVTGAVIEHLESEWLAGGSIDIPSYSALSNTQKRLLETVGLKRVPRNVSPTLSQYLEAKKNEATE
jgi:hypothetical protein